MNGYEAYKIYVSMKAHFRGDKYDFFRYGRISPKVQTFENRKDRHFFDKLAKRHCTEESMIHFLLSQMQENPNMWIGTMFGEDIKTLVTYASIHEDFTPNAWSKLFVCENNNHPKIMKLLMQKKITPETFCVLDKMLSFTNNWNSSLTGDPVWEEMRGRTIGYRGFLEHTINIQTLKETVRKILCEST